MNNKITCTCGHSWDKSDSSKKDATVCHICGKNNVMQLGGNVYPVNYVPQAEQGWLSKYEDGGSMQEYQENYNDSSVSMGPGFVGMGNNTKGRNYSPAWGGQFAMGGNVPGSVGFTYARTGDIPSNGPYAKKTMASAQKGASVVDSISHQANKILQYEQLKGGPGGTPLPQYSDPKYMQMLMQSVYPEVKKIMPDASAMESGEAMDFIFNAGWDKTNNKITKDPRAFALQEYYRQNDKSKLDSDGKWSGRKNPAYSFDQEYSSTIGKLPENERRILMNKGRDWYYQNINNPSPGVPSSDYKDTWYGRVWNTNDYNEFDPSNPKFTPKKQNGGEMKFYQEGLDWKPRNISRDGSEIPQAQLGTHMLTPDFSQVGENIMEMLSVPQKALTKLISGKYQTPSEAMGIKNKVGAIATDILLDPVNLVGGTAAAKIAKGVKAAKATKSASKIVNNAVKTAKPTTINSSINKVKNLEDLKATQQFAKQYGYGLPENLERIAQSDELTNRTVRGLMDKHNTFVRGVSTNWDAIKESNPAVLRHLEELGIDYINNPQQAAEYMSTHIPGNTGYGRFGLKPGENAIYLSNSVPTAEGYTYGQGYITKVKRPTDFSSANRQDWISANDFDASLDFKGSPFGQGIVKNDYVKRFPTNLRETLAITGDPNKVTKLGEIIKEKEGLYNKLSEEAWRRDNNSITKLRYKTDANYRRNSLSDDPVTRDKPNFLDNLQLKYLEAKKDLTQTYYDNLPLKDVIKGIYGDPDVWKAFGKNLFGELDPFSHYAIKGAPGTKALEVVNSKKITPEMWQNTSRGHINKYSNKLSRKEEGGEITKDDNGYWNPENWGEPVEIGSNEITMQGVYEPLLGVSDTGDTQMMYPGEDYKFKGKKVTEYPIKKNGGWLEKYK